MNRGYGSSGSQDISGKVDKVTGSSLVPDTEIAKIHTQNTDTKLDEGGANEVSASSIKSTISKFTTENKTYYVDYNSGNDTTGDGTYESPYKTINKAISLIPEIVNHYITIDCNSIETFAENITITGKTGSGEIDITNIGLNTYATCATISKCSCKILFDTCYMKATGSGGTCFSITDCSYVEISGRVEDDESAYTAGLNVQYSKVYLASLSNGSANKVATAIQSWRGSIVVFNSSYVNSSTLGDTFAYCLDGGIVSNERNLVDDYDKLDGIEYGALAIDSIKAESDIADAISNKHTQNTDTVLKNSIGSDVINNATVKSDVAVDDGIALGIVKTVGDNTFLGQSAGANRSTFSQSVFVGYEAGLNTNTGTANVFVGRQTGRLVETGGSNTFVGSAINGTATTVNWDTFIGHQAGQNATGDNSVCVGKLAGRACANNVVYIGQGAGQLCTGKNNVAIGKEAGYGAGLIEGNVMIGCQVGKSNITGSNILAIDNSDTATPLVYGEFDNRLVKINGNLYIVTIKSGATQVGAGAVAGEIWKTASHATLPDNVLMIGV